MGDVTCVPSVSQLLTVATYLSNIPERCKLLWAEYKYTPVDSALAGLYHWYYGTPGLKACQYIEDFVSDMEIYLNETKPKNRSEVLIETFKKCPNGIRNLRTTYSRDDGKLEVCTRLTRILEIIDTLKKNLSTAR